ncbi:MAG: hypothetical protein LC687_06195 [Actinobacteria bacterium]|nr:hypothetical protein [Actinomycetota bacterium]
MIDYDAEEFCEDCEEQTIMWKVNDHDKNVIEYYCRNKYCGANWVEYATTV